MRIAVPAGRRAAPGGPEPRNPATPGFDRAVALGAVLLVGGLYLDGWAHVHGHVDGTFFTPWHAVLYSAFLALAAIMAATAVRGQRRGLSWRQSVPPGYELSLLGVVIFLAGGAADMVWHLVFGFEVNVDALFSPTHLVLATGGTLLGTGPLRSAWRRRDEGPREAMPWPAVLSLLATLGVFTFFTQIAHPLVDPTPAGARPVVEPLVFFNEALGVASIVLQTAIVMGLVLVAVRGFVLPAGAFTLLFGLNAFAMSFEGNLILGSAGGLRFVPAALAAGILADLLYAAIRAGPLAGRPAGLRLLAACVPAIFYLLYFLTLMATTGIWWKIHLWLGSVALAGIVGWLLSYVAIPPAGAAAGEGAWR